MKVFMSGGHGFLGSHWKKSLLENGFKVVAPKSTECDLTNVEELKLIDYKFDLIFHLAAWTQAGDWCLTHPGEQWLINQQINTNILDWWFKYQKNAKLIAIGTSCSYDTTLPLKETNYLKGEPEESLYSYAMTKRMLLTGLQSLNKQYGMQYLHFIPATLYGPGYNRVGKQKHFIFDLINKIVFAKKFGGEVVLWGNGLQRREVVHVNDFILNANSLIKTVSNDSFNLGNVQDLSIIDYAKIICNLVEYDYKKIKFDTTRYVGVKQKFLDSKKARNFLGDSFSISDIAENIEKIIMEID